MAWTKKAQILLAAALLAISFGAIAAKGKLGFGTEATISGFFKPVLKRVKVTTVETGSPAAAAGLRPGDYVVEANGRTIEGAPAREMAGQLKNVQSGQRLQLKIKRGDSLLNVEIIAGS